MKILKTLSIVLIALVAFGFTSMLNPDKNISELVAEKQELSTLLTALEATDLAETLKGEGPYTVFAPTNEGFNNLPEGKLDELLRPESKEALAKILKYHVVSGEFYASDLYDGQWLETLEGTKIKITGTPETPMDEEGVMEEGVEEVMEGQTASTVKINNANIVEKDLVASNGIIHVIDAVVMPTDIEALGSVEEY